MSPHKRQGLINQSNQMRSISTSLALFISCIGTFTHASALKSSLNYRDPYCNGPNSPVENGNCNYYQTEPCCTDATHLATCELHLEGSKWGIKTCKNSCGYDEFDNCVCS
jgi:hypothetical protein